MNYKNRFIFLVSLTAVLALLYTGSLIFNSGYGSSRNSSYVWLDSKNSARISRIVINRGGEELTLFKQNNIWTVSHNGRDYPARLVRVDDFLSIFTKRASWPLRSSSASSHERFGLASGAPQITIYGENTILLGILVGDDDATGRAAYFRKTGENEVRSGDNSVKTYINSPLTSWYNLRLITDSEGGQIDVSNIMRLIVKKGDETQIFTKRNRVWNVSGIEVSNPDQTVIDNYIRTVINTEGDNFTDDVSADDPIFDKDRITAEISNGVIVTIRLSEADESGRRFAHVSGRDYIYSIPSWAVFRLFMEAENFEMNNSR